MNKIETRDIFSKNLNHFLEINKKSKAQFARDIGAPRTTVSGWCTGAVVPGLSKLHQIADYFDVKVDMLLSPSEKWSFDDLLFVETAHFQDSQWRRLLAYAKYLKSNPEEKYE